MDVVVVVHPQISIRIKAGPTRIIRKVRGVAVLISPILQIALYVKFATKLVMWPYSVTTVSTTLTPWTTLLRCKLFLLLKNKLWTQIGTLTPVPPIILLMILQT